jgi:hypothetical protein
MAAWDKREFLIGKEFANSSISLIMLYYSCDFLTSGLKSLGGDFGTLGVITPSSALPR